MATVGIAAEANDMLSIADAAKLDRFGVFSQSGSALSAIYLVDHYPDRVATMVWNGGHAEGRDLRPKTIGTQGIFGMIAKAWDKPDSSFLHAYSLLYLPEGPLDLAKDLVEIMNKSCPADNMQKTRRTFNEV
jgi:pimeloyl-ACP methyl ester carboxylesterase